MQAWIMHLGWHLRHSSTALAPLGRKRRRSRRCTAAASEEHKSPRAAALRGTGGSGMQARSHPRAAPPSARRLRCLHCSRAGASFPGPVARVRNAVPFGVMEIPLRMWEVPKCGRTPNAVQLCPPLWVKKAYFSSPPPGECCVPTAAKPSSGVRNSSFAYSTGRSSAVRD